MQMPVKTLVDQGYGHHRKGELAEAENCYTQALAMEAENADAIHYLGILYRQTERPAEGLALLRKSVTLSPGESSFHYNLANALDDEQLEVEAEAAYRKAIEIKPDYPSAEMNLALVLQKQAKFEEALVLLEALVKKAPKSVAAHLNLARLYDTLGLRTQAFMEYCEVVDAGRNASALCILSEFLGRSGDIKQALKVAQEAADLEPENPLAWMEVAKAQFANQAKDEAVTATKKVLTLAPDHAEATHFLAALEGRAPKTSF